MPGPGRRFSAGTSGNPNGRPKGAQSQRTRAIMEFLRSTITDVEWQESARRRMLAGKAPHLELYMLQKVNGKPTERVQVHGQITTQDKRSLLQLLPEPIITDLIARGGQGAPDETVN